MRRRHFTMLLGAAAAAWPRAARAQQPGKIYRLGLLANGPVGPLDARRVALLSALAARGFAEGKNLVLVHRSAEAHPERLARPMAQLHAERVDVIVPFSCPRRPPAQKA